MIYRDDPALSVNIKGLTFHTPVGLAAGFDKHAEAPLAFCKYGDHLCLIAVQLMDNCRVLDRIKTKQSRASF